MESVEGSDFKFVVSLNVLVSSGHMHLGKDIHLSYSTNIHRGNSWEETFAGLRNYTLRVRQEVCAQTESFGIGLRLSDQASRELMDGQRLADFRRWLEAQNCYVFTINGFPYGNFHGTRVKEQVYAPDWQSPERLAYTNRLFSLLALLLPHGMDGSVSTLPCSFKPFITKPAQVDTIKANLIECARHIESLCELHGCDLHLGLEPEPFGYLETTPEAIGFFAALSAQASDPGQIQRRIGVNYDTCHMAIQFEDAAESLDTLARNQIRISKIHLSSALRVVPNEPVREALRAFIDPVYLHQVVSRNESGQIRRWQDLDLALEASAVATRGEEWRIHFHVPLYAEPEDGMLTTIGHLEDSLDYLARSPSICNHFEFETYTWEVLPPRLRAESVTDQLVAEYQWCFDAFTTRGLYVS